MTDEEEDLVKITRRNYARSRRSQKLTGGKRAALRQHFGPLLFTSIIQINEQPETRWFPSPRSSDQRYKNHIYNCLETVEIRAKVVSYLIFTSMDIIIALEQRKQYDLIYSLTY